MNGPVDHRQVAHPHTGSKRTTALAADETTDIDRDCLATASDHSTRRCPFNGLATKRVPEAGESIARTGKILAATGSGPVPRIRAPTEVGQTAMPRQYGSWSDQSTSPW